MEKAKLSAAEKHGHGPQWWQVAKAKSKPKVQALLLTPSCLPERCGGCRGCQRYEGWKVAYELFTAPTLKVRWAGSWKFRAGPFGGEKGARFILGFLSFHTLWGLHSLYKDQSHIGKE